MPCIRNTCLLTSKQNTLTQSFPPKLLYFDPSNAVLDRLQFRPQLFIVWITLSTGWIAIQWIRVNKTNHTIRWIVIYAVDSGIHVSNNPGQVLLFYITQFGVTSIKFVIRLLLRWLAAISILQWMFSLIQRF